MDDICAEEKHKNNFSPYAPKISKELPQAITDDILGLIVQPCFIHIGCRGRQYSEPGEVLVSSNSTGMQAGWRATYDHEISDKVETLCFEYLGRDIGSPTMDLSWEMVCKALYREMKYDAGKEDICFKIKDEGELTVFASKIAAAAANMKYLNYISGLIRADKSMEQFVKQVEHIPLAFPKLELIVIEFDFEGTREDMENYLPFRSPEQIMSKELTGGKEDAHARFLRAVVTIVDNLPLKSVIIFWSGGFWTDDEEMIWDNFVDHKLEEAKNRRLEESDSDTTEADIVYESEEENSKNADNKNGYEMSNGNEGYEEVEDEEVEDEEVEDEEGEEEEEEEDLDDYSSNSN